MKVVLYLRYSSDHQTEQSIEGQKRVCEEFCRREGHEIVNIYIDRATSAYKDPNKRTSFTKMVKDSEKQLWQGVVVYKLDRFARNRYDSATYKAKLKKNGVKLISATENISDNPEGVILEAVLEGMAEFYSLELAQKITRGMHESALKSQSTGGALPLGYKIENKKYVIDEATAPIVKEAFSLYASGMTVSEICQKFNEKGYRSSKHTPFNKSSFKSMLRNEKYTGVYKYQDVRIEGGMPAIIDKPLFDVVQAKLRANKKAPGRGKAKVPYLLSQKLFCGHCGATMSGEGTVKPSGKAYYYYVCSTQKLHHTCDKKRVPKDWIEDVVAEKTLEMLTPELIDQIADMAVEMNRKDIASNALIPSLEREIADCDNRINNLIKIAETGVECGNLSDRITELTSQKKDAEKRLLSEKANTVVLEKEHIVWFLTQFCDGDIEDFAVKRRLINLLVNSVTLWDEPDGGFKMTIWWNLSDHQTDTIRVNIPSTFEDECSTKRKAVEPDCFFRLV